MRNTVCVKSTMLRATSVTVWWGTTSRSSACTNCDPICSGRRWIFSSEATIQNVTVTATTVTATTVEQELELLLKKIKGERHAEVMQLRQQLQEKDAIIQRKDQQLSRQRQENTELNQRLDAVHAQLEQNERELQRGQVENTETETIN